MRELAAKINGKVCAIRVEEDKKDKETLEVSFVAPAAVGQDQEPILILVSKRLMGEIASAIERAALAAQIPDGSFPAKTYVASQGSAQVSVEDCDTAKGSRLVFREVAILVKPRKSQPFEVRLSPNVASENAGRFAARRMEATLAKIEEKFETAFRPPEVSDDSGIRERVVRYLG